MSLAGILPMNFLHIFFQVMLQISLKSKLNSDKFIQVYMMSLKSENIPWINAPQKYLGACISSKWLSDKVLKAWKSFVPFLPLQ